jgi:hypothetical protein
VIVGVKLINREGQRATKEYDVTSFRWVMRAVPCELKDYPQFRIADIWAKGERHSSEPSDRGHRPVRPWSTP